MRYISTPSDGYPSVRARVSLGGSTYGVHWLWNQRARVWTFSMFGPSGSRIVSGVRVVLNINLVEWARVDERPPYPILVLDPSGGIAEPGLEDLGRRVKVVYMEPST